MQNKVLCFLINVALLINYSPFGGGGLIESSKEISINKFIKAFAHIFI